MHFRGIRKFLGKEGADNTDDGQEDIVVVLAQLRALARSYLSRERVGHTLQPTALVNELWMKISARTAADAEDREKFFGFAARAMRQILVDHARARNAAKRVEVVSQPDGHRDGRQVELILLDQTLSRLAAMDPRQAQIVDLRFLCGFTVEEIADMLGLSTKTVHREWATARAWLRREMNR